MPLQRALGAVAILDALGTSTQSDAEIEQFVRGRDRVIGLLNGKAEGVQLADQVKTFTFGDTILIALTSQLDDLPGDCTKLMTVLRKFLVDSLDHGLLFRGSVAIGEHHSDDDTNTALGPAVNDAASWYEQAEWVGLHLTPLSSMRLDEWSGRGDGPGSHLVVDYEVPLKGGVQKLKAVNWPKVFFVPAIVPEGVGSKPREYLLGKLTARPIPRGVETKYRNTIAFYDSIVKEQSLKPALKKVKKRPGSNVLGTAS